jgi:hypothetical protein
MQAAGFPRELYDVNALLLRYLYFFILTILHLFLFLGSAVYI